MHKKIRILKTKSKTPSQPIHPKDKTKSNMTKISNQKDKNIFNKDSIVENKSNKLENKNSDLLLQNPKKALKNPNLPPKSLKIWKLSNDQMLLNQITKIKKSNFMQNIKLT